MKLHSLQDLFVDQIRDLYNAEHQLIKALPKMARAASSSELQEAFGQHLEQTRNQATRLERVFDKLNLPHRGKKCRAMEGLIEEGKELFDLDADAQVLDAALIAAAQRIEHYEIAGYGCARTFATLVGDEEAAALLEQSLQEEKDTDAKLTELALDRINKQAADQQGEPAMQMQGEH